MERARDLIEAEPHHALVVGDLCALAGRAAGSAGRAATRGTRVAAPRSDRTGAGVAAAAAGRRLLRIFDVSRRATQGERRSAQGEQEGTGTRVRAPNR